MPNIDIKTLASSIASLAEVIQENDKHIRLSELSDIFSKLEASESYRTDQVIRNVANIVERRANANPNGLISREEFGQLYDAFAGLNPNSNFKNIFSEVLPVGVAVAKPTAEASRDNFYFYERNPNSIEVDEDTEEPSADVFASTIPSQPLSVVEAGLDLVKDELEMLGQKLPIDFEGDTDTGMIYSVDLGMSRKAYIPIEVVNRVPIPPKVIVANQSEFPFSREGFDRATRAPSKNSFIRQHFSTYRDVPMSEEIIEVDEYTELDDKTVMPDALLPFAVVAEQRLLESSLGYPVEIVASGRELVETELMDLGYPLVKVKATNRNDDGIIYTADIETEQGKFAIDVPITIDNRGIAAFPSHFHYGEAQDKYELSRQGFDKLLATATIDPPRYSGDMIEMTYSELRKELLTSTMKRDFTRATEVLALVDDKFGSEHHKACLSDYAEWLKDSKVSFAARCGSCNYYENASKGKSTQDWCLLIDRPCREIRQTKAGICVKSSVDFDSDLEKDELSISTSKVALT